MTRRSCSVVLLLVLLSSSTTDACLCGLAGLFGGGGGGGGCGCSGASYGSSYGSSYGGGFGGVGYAQPPLSQYPIAAAPSYFPQQQYAVQQPLGLAPPPQPQYLQAPPAPQIPYGGAPVARSYVPGPAPYYPPVAQPRPIPAPAGPSAPYYPPVAQPRPLPAPAAPYYPPQQTAVLPSQSISVAPQPYNPQPQQQVQVPQQQAPFEQPDDNSVTAQPVRPTLDSFEVVGEESATIAYQGTTRISPANGKGRNPDYDYFYVYYDEDKAGNGKKSKITKKLKQGVAEPTADSAEEVANTGDDYDGVVEGDNNDEEEKKRAINGRPVTKKPDVVQTTTRRAPSTIPTASTTEATTVTTERATSTTEAPTTQTPSTTERSVPSSTTAKPTAATTTTRSVAKTTARGEVVDVIDVTGPPESLPAPGTVKVVRKGDLEIEYEYYEVPDDGSASTVIIPTVTFAPSNEGRSALPDDYTDFQDNIATSKSSKVQALTSKILDSLTETNLAKDGISDDEDGSASSLNAKLDPIEKSALELDHIVKREDPSQPDHTAIQPYRNKNFKNFRRHHRN